MKTNLLWFAAGIVTIPIAAALGGLIFLKTGSNGFSARSDPSFVETFAAQQARGMAMASGAKDRANPVVKSKEALDEAMAHWADHCAVCHANDGSGQMDMGRQMYPHAPDMRKAPTQQLTDGELFYIIENGIRLSGMPAWGGSEHGEKESWKLVHFIRHLRDLSAAETAQMEAMNPKGPEDKEQDQLERQFLDGKTPVETMKQHKH